MKRLFCILLSTIILLSLCSCGESVNMGVLTEYQNGGFEAELRLSIGGKEHFCSLTKSDGRFFLRLREMSSFTFVFDENGAGIISGDTEIPIGDAGMLPLYGVYGIFSAPVSGTWKIEKARPGGVSLYICEGEGITLYIGASSHLPLKIISGSIEADVLSFKVTQNGDT